MSFIVSVKGRGGIALATDSRMTTLGEGAQYETYDGAHKLLTFPAPHSAVGALVYGHSRMANRWYFTAEWVRSLGESLPPERWKVRDYAEFLSYCFMRESEAAAPPTEENPSKSHFSYDTPYYMCAVVAGYDPGDDEGHVYTVSVPDRAEPVEQHPGGVGMLWGGQREFADRLILGYDARVGEFLRFSDESLRKKTGEGLHLDGLVTRFPLAQMTVQESADLAAFLVRTTIDAQRVTDGLCGVGGGVDVATITAADGLKIVQAAERPDGMPVVCRTASQWPGATADAPEDMLRPAAYAARPASAMTAVAERSDP